MILPAAIFRAYDIRGTYPITLNEDMVRLIGQAIGSQVLELNQTSIIMGRDGRLSSPALFQALQEGIRRTGCDVIDIGIVPTPVLYFATKTLSTQSGVMLTGSHNPADDNGLKIVLAGKTLCEEDIQQLYHRVVKQNFLRGQGQLNQHDILPAYRDRILSDIQVGRKLKLVMDCSNGVAATIAPELFRKLGCEVVELYCELDGCFPNHSPDPSQPENNQALIREVKKSQADLGIMFDGDTDRLGVVTREGEIIWPDRQMILFAQQVIQQNPEATILYDVKCSKQLKEAIENAGGYALMWKTGHSLIKAKMLEVSAKLAGEMSGHIFFNDRWYGFDDGIYSAARLIEILSASTQHPSEVFAKIPNAFSTPELRIAVPESQKFEMMEKLIAQARFEQGEIFLIDGLRVEFADSWGLIRPSNTSPYLIARFEADSAHALEKVKSLFRHFILTYASDLNLPF